MESLGNLAGGIAHDFNNMLLPILTLSSMAMRDLPEGDRQRRRLGMVVEAAERARALVQRILAFSRTGDSTRESIDMAGIVGDAVDLLRVTLPKTIDLATRVNPHTGEAHVDRAQVQTMILNLASNAADAMGGKPGRLEIDLDRVEIDDATSLAQPGLAAGPYARLIVRDTGSGIPEEIRSRIFEPFFTTKKVGEGTGLGLAMVHGIVTEHDGTISVESAMGVGTTIQILLPLRTRQRTAESAAGK
jgi:signal transduction histidine kinase